MYEDDLALALTLADAADRVTIGRFQAADLSVASKPDLTPVTDADLDTERTLRRLLDDHRPADELLGEEFGGERHSRGRQWVIDPIDGTKNFVRGVPVWATLIALLVDGTPVVGVVSAPALGRRWWAAAGRGAFRRVSLPDVERADEAPPGPSEGERIRCSEVSRLADASLAFSSLTGWKQRGLRERFLALTDSCWRVRGFGDFLSYVFVAEGATDIALEPEVSLWDLAALDIIVREAGGRFTDLRGCPGPAGGEALATNGRLHDAVISALHA